MSKLWMVWVVPVIAALGGCGVAAKVNARHDMEASKVAYKACLAERGQDAAACDGLRQAYEADLSAYRATSAAIRPVYSYGETAPVAPALSPLPQPVAPMPLPQLPPVSGPTMHSCINSGNFTFCR